MVTKMKSRFSIGLALFASLATIAMAAVDGYQIKQTQKEGDIHKYKIQADVDVMGQKATFTAKSIEKVVKVGADGSYEAQSEQIDGKLEFGGNQMDAPSTGAVVYAYNANGTLKEIRGESANASTYRMANLRTFFIPEKAVNVGDTWNYSIKSDAKTGAVTAIATYKVLAAEKLGKWDTLKIQYTVKETDSDGATADTTVWLSTTTWEPVQAEAKWTNVPVDGSPAPVNGTMKMTLIED